jgi:hypothetical protein
MTALYLSHLHCANTWTETSGNLVMEYSLETVGMKFNNTCLVFTILNASIYLHVCVFPVKIIHLHFSYACMKYLMTPYRNSDTPSKERYNRAHCRTRVAVEMAFGSWKRRFGILHGEVYITCTLY